MLESARWTAGRAVRRFCRETGRHRGKYRCAAGVVVDVAAIPSYLPIG